MRKTYSRPRLAKAVLLQQITALGSIDNQIDNG